MLKQQSISLKVKKKGRLISEVSINYKQQNHYEKVKLIGQGTFGKVYLAKNKKDNKLYAVKQVLQDPRYKNRQLGIISRIEHQNIICMIDYYIKIVNEDYYLNVVMEYVPNSLNIMIKQRRKDKLPFAPDVRKLIIFQLFKGLYYMQLNNVCHRDLKPPNILVNDQTYEVKICDFGSAKILQKKQKNVSYIVSRYYRAPQLILGSSSYGTEIDIWSAGCIMIQLLTLEPIFPGDSTVEQLIEVIKILGTPPEKLIKIYEQANLTTLSLPKLKASSWQKILKKYNPQPQLIDLIQKVLTYDTEKRLRPCQVLCHPYFSDLTKLEHLTKQLPKIFNFASLNNKKNKVQIGMLDKIFNKKEELQLKNSNSKLSLEIVSKDETLPSSTSPQDQKSRLEQVQGQGKINEINKNQQEVKSIKFSNKNERGDSIDKKVVSSKELKEK